MKILLTGGGTLGSVSPLLATAEQLRKKKHEFLFVGTTTGPERALVEKAGITFTSIVAPRFRRFITWKHLLLPFKMVVSLIQVAWILLRFRPDVIVAAGGYVAVPIIWVGWLLKVPSIIHQQDVEPGLANKITQWFAKKVTVTFETSLTDFDSSKVEWIGNPVRSLVPRTDNIELDPDFVTVLIVGGGTGAQAINELVTEAVADDANVIHVTGKGRGVNKVEHPRYHRYDFLNEEYAEAIHKADIVVSRAGLSAITELSALAKPSIIIPMPNSHQERNAELLEKNHAALVLHQRDLNDRVFARAITALAEDKEMQQSLATGMHSMMKPHASESLARIVEEVASHS